MVSQHWGTIAGSVSSVVFLIVAAIAYRKLNRRIIVAARLDDPHNEYSEPVGHQYRAKIFCQLLGMSVWLESSAILGECFPFVPGRPLVEWREFAINMGPIIGGYLAYKITRWSLSPRTRPSLPAGRGFDVLSVSIQPNRPA
jgi:hypothetical protein